jgi:hypothetical protein
MNKSWLPYQATPAAAASTGDNVMSEVFSILERISGSDRLHIVSAAELRTFCDELEKLPYQILAGRREGDKMDQIEIFITYSAGHEEGEF